MLSWTEDHTVTEGHLELVRQNVGGNWKQVARKLGLTDIDVDTIEHDYDRDGLAEKVHQTLERWKMKEGLLGITVGKLCRALEGCIKSSVLLQLLYKSQDCAAVPWNATVGLCHNYFLYWRVGSDGVKRGTLPNFIKRWTITRLCSIFDRITSIAVTQRRLFIFTGLDTCRMLQNNDYNSL